MRKTLGLKNASRIVLKETPVHHEAASMVEFGWSMNIIPQRVLKNRFQFNHVAENRVKSVKQTFQNTSNKNSESFAKFDQIIMAKVSIETISLVK